MTYAQLIAYFGRPPDAPGALTRAAARLGLPISTVASWRTRGVPVAIQYMAQVKSRGKLRAEDAERPAQGMGPNP